MCKDCGCGIASPVATAHDHQVLARLLAGNDHMAQHNREHFDQHAVTAFNLMSAPGSGKTALLEATIEALRPRFRIAVIEGDLATENDAARIRAHGVPAVQITTGTACHLDAHMVHEALHELELDDIDIVFIENVGNLVCPAAFDLGQHRNVALLSVTEGDDKPAKYPVLFRAADLVLISKSDLLPFIDDFDPARAGAAMRAIASAAPLFVLSAKRRLDLEPWLRWISATVEATRARVAA